ncbi:hypothetical protein [Massilia sp. ST3]|uniref:hypothetical protein n=1 Tax=Massilia sp. ST3 TaxID=2824903 RepID=UPI001B82F6F2|nr:hypothetical protein [Massilia sp. ST3]MBQ5949893.1 hypothetical protein [Massilia sp. ST3]
MSGGIDSAVVRSVDPRGGFLSVTATRRPRAGRADVKCSVPDAPDVARRMQQAVRLARHTEARADSRDQVVLGLDRAPAEGSRDWELAAVLADRIVRGLWAPKQPVIANGWSDAWHLGRVDGCALAQLPEGAIAGGPQGLAHLGALLGQPDPAIGVASARAWFPLHSGGEQDSLGWVEVSLRPFAHAAADEEGAVAAPQLDAARQAQVRAVLAASRHFDGRGQGQWRTTVRFGEPRFQGDSYELALVLADRMARGREFLARGRVIATGRSSAWHAGRVEAVDGLAPKCALILRELAAGDRVLLPREWEAALPPGLREDARARGASLACVERIGII